MSTCNCRLYSGCSIENYSIDSARNYQLHPCKEVLMMGEGDERRKWSITKTAFSLKHWAFVGALKFIQVRKLRSLYRKQYLHTLGRIVKFSKMTDNFGFCVRSLYWDNRDTYFFDEIIRKGLTIHSVSTSQEAIFPLRSFRNFAPFCTCNMLIKGYVTIRNDGSPPFHYLRLPKNRLYYPCETIERNGHYDFCCLND